MSSIVGNEAPLSLAKVSFGRVLTKLRYFLLTKVLYEKKSRREASSPDRLEEEEVDDVDVVVVSSSWLKVSGAHKPRTGIYAKLKAAGSSV